MLYNWHNNDLPDESDFYTTGANTETVTWAKSNKEANATNITNSQAQYEVLTNTNIVQPITYLPQTHSKDHLSNHEQEESTFNHRNSNDQHSKSTSSNLSELSLLTQEQDDTNTTN